MNTINLGGDPQKDQQTKDGPQPIPKPVGATPSPADISINFTPVIANQEKKPEVIKMDIKKDDLNKIGAGSTPVSTEKKGLLANIFSKKPAVTPPEVTSKPSAAWKEALDVAKDAAPATAPTTAPAATKPVEFFSSSALQDKSGLTNRLVENIATQKAKLEKPKVEELLGKRSTILEKSIEEETQMNLKKKLRLLQLVALFVTALTLGINSFLYYQLSPGVNLMGYVNYNFDNNLRNDLFNLNQSLRSVQTTLNKSRYLAGQLYLNQFGYESTRFMDGVAKLSKPGTQEAKAEIQSIVEEAKNHMPDLLAGAQSNLLQPIVANTFKTRGEDNPDDVTETLAFQSDLRAAIQADKKALAASGLQSNIEVPQQALSFFDNAAKLVGNAKLLANLRASTVDAFRLETEAYQNEKDAAQQLAFKQSIDDLLASTKVNLATITSLRNSRITWSNVLNRMEVISNDVNTQHNSGTGAGNGSRISFSGFDFNASTGKVTINGINTTLAGTNREVVTYLIEALEASPEFKNVVDRSFPLSKTTDANGNSIFTLNFKIDMEIEKGSFSKLNKPIADLQTKSVAFNKVPVKK